MILRLLLRARASLVIRHGGLLEAMPKNGAAGPRFQQP